MDILVTAAGCLLIIFASVDMFREVVLPNASGTISLRVAGLLWRAAPRKTRLLSLVAPLSMMISVAAWVGAMVIGWALIIWVQLPGDFVYGSGVPARAGFIEALYVSQVTLVTLGYGDLVPSDGWLRIVFPLEAFLGFGLLSAATSWVLSIYPPISRRHFLAHDVSVSHAAERELGLHEDGPLGSSLSAFFERMTAQVVSVRSDIVQFPILYYFHALDRRASMPAQIPFLWRRSEHYSSQRYSAEVNLQAARLRIALEDLASVLNGFLGLPDDASAREILEAFAAEHEVPSDEE